MSTDSTYRSSDGKGAVMNFDSVTHACANGIVIGAIMGWLPPLAAAVTLTYYLILIAEKFTDTKCSTWFKRKVK